VRTAAREMGRGLVWLVAVQLQMYPAFGAAKRTVGLVEGGRVGNRL